RTTRGSFCILLRYTTLFRSVGAMGADDAQVVVVHMAQVGHRDVGVQGGGKAPAIPRLLHGEVVGVAGGVDGIVKGVVDDGVAQGDRKRTRLKCSHVSISDAV